MGETSSYDVSSHFGCNGVAELLGFHLLFHQFPHLRHVRRLVGFSYGMFQIVYESCLYADAEVHYEMFGLLLVLVGLHIWLA